jgi:hypothetical protein
VLEVSTFHSVPAFTRHGDFLWAGPPLVGRDVLR